MSKDRISATVDPEVKEQAERSDVCTSTVVNRLLKEYFAAGGDSLDMLKLRREQIKSDIEQHKSQIETLRNELEQVETKIDNMQAEQRSELEETLETLESVPWQVDNTAIQDQAKHHDLTPEELIQKLEDYHA